MVRAFVVCLAVVVPLLAACSGPSTAGARIVVFTTSSDRVPRNDAVTLVWQAADAGVQDGLASCLLTRRFDGDPAETTAQATCAGSLTEVPAAPLSVAAVHYTFQVLKQPYDAGDAYLTQTRTVVLDAARYVVRAGGTGDETTMEIDARSDGSAVVVGYYSNGSATFGTTTLANAGVFDEAFVANVDAGGAWTWATRAGGSSLDQANGVSALPDGGALVTGVFAFTAAFGGTNLTSAGDVDVFLGRIDPDGAWAWATRAGGSTNDTANAVGALDDGGAIVVGRFSSSATFGTTTLTSAGSSDVFVARADATGAWSWATRAGGGSSDEAYDVAVLPDGGAIVAGLFSGSAVFGSTVLDSVGGHDVFVARIDPDGGWTWATRAGGTATDMAYGTSALADGGALVAGFVNGTAAFGATVLTSAGADDVFVARIDPHGAWTWATGAGGSDADVAYSVRALPDGGGVVAGRFRGSAAFDATLLASNAASEDVFVARIDADGAWTWATRAGGTSNEYAVGATALPDGGAIATGFFDTTATFGTRSVTSAGNRDAFVARIGTDGRW